LVKKTQQTQPGIEAENTWWFQMPTTPKTQVHNLLFVILPLFSLIPYEFINPEIKKVMSCLNCNFILTEIIKLNNMF
jgi:hypothetical protein